MKIWQNQEWSQVHVILYTVLYTIYNYEIYKSSMDVRKHWAVSFQWQRRLTLLAQSCDLSSGSFAAVCSASFVASLVAYLSWILNVVFLARKYGKAPVHFARIAVPSSRQRFSENCEIFAAKNVAFAAGTALRASDANVVAEWGIPSFMT